MGVYVVATQNTGHGVGVDAPHDTGHGVGVDAPHSTPSGLRRGGLSFMGCVLCQGLLWYPWLSFIGCVSS